MNILKESPLENVVKDIGEVYTRMLDHRAIIQGELKIFVKEFETRRSDKECKRLDADLEKLQEVNAKVGPECVTMMKNHVTNLQDQLEVANKICSNLQNQEEKHMEINPLNAERRKREENWTNFLEELSKERDHEDVEHARAMQAIDDHFAKLVETLSTSSS